VRDRRHFGDYARELDTANAGCSHAMEDSMAKALDVNDDPKTDPKKSVPERNKDEKLHGKHAQVNENSVEDGEPVHPDEAGERSPQA
jgi:hypothetical protein